MEGVKVEVEVEAGLSGVCQTVCRVSVYENKRGQKETGASVSKGTETLITGPSKKKRFSPYRLFQACMGALHSR